MQGYSVIQVIDRNDLAEKFEGRLSLAFEQLEGAVSAKRR